jgi:hypothetical protein
MTNPTFDFNTFLDASKKAFAPAVKFNELSFAASASVSGEPDTAMAFAAEDEAAGDASEPPEADPQEQGS